MRILYKIGLVVGVVLIAGCSDMLDLRPKNKLDADALFADPKGVEAYMANLYSQLPIEDFNYLKGGFNDFYGENFGASMFTDEATHSEYATHLTPSNFLWWDQAFKLNMDINILKTAIPKLNISETQRTAMIGEVAFLKAYTYFGLAKRYGGVPIIDDQQQWTGNLDELKVPRSTEKDTWDYILNQCDIAATNLPSIGESERRATCWTAYALKTRAALHAASIAKFGSRAVLSGAAVDKNLVGLTSDLAEGYYEAAIKAADQIMKSGKFSLYKSIPQNPTEAAENYRKMFEDPSIAPEEVMFTKGYTVEGEGHNYNIYYGPAQTANGWPHPGRMNPNLEFVDAFESYDNPGHSSPIITSTAANDLTDYNGFNVNKQYKKFDNPYEIFEGKDARLSGTVILPGTEWKKTTIVIQAGFIKPDGTPVLYSNDNIKVGDKTYYTFGAKSSLDYSGFDTQGGNYTRTGFGFKKFLDQRIPTLYGYDKSLTDFIDFRYAEVLLNYAEAVVESGYVGDGAQAKAKQALNDIRKRAAHKTDIELTSENVQRERLVELSFENKHFWDLMRRREFHLLRNGNVMHALLPVLDLRENPAKYIFIRKDVQRVVKFTFYEKMYYHAIPGTASNGLIQNPQY